MASSSDFDLTMLAKSVTFAALVASAAAYVPTMVSFILYYCLCWYQMRFTLAYFLD